jgi:tetratricopeptide (TPR) repeat protein
MAKLTNDELSKISEILSPLDKDPVRNETLNPTVKILRKIKGIPEPKFDDNEVVSNETIDFGEDDSSEVEDFSKPPEFKNFDEDDDTDLDIDDLLSSADDFMKGGDIPKFDSPKPKEPEADLDIPDDFTHSELENNIDKDISPDEEDELTVDPEASTEIDPFADVGTPAEQTDPFVNLGNNTGDTDPFANVGDVLDPELDPFADVGTAAADTTAEDTDIFGDVGTASADTTVEDADIFGDVGTTTDDATREDTDIFGDVGTTTDDATREDTDIFGDVGTTADDATAEDTDIFGDVGTTTDDATTEDTDIFGDVGTTTDDATTEDADIFGDVGTTSDDATTEDTDIFGDVGTTTDDEATDDSDPFASLDDKEIDSADDADFGNVGTTADDDPFATLSDDDNTEATDDTFGSLGDSGEPADDDMFSGIGDDLEDSGTRKSSVSTPNAVDDDPFSTASFNAVEDEIPTTGGGLGLVSDVNDYADDSDSEPVAEQDIFSDFQESTSRGDDFGVNLDDSDDIGFGSEETAGSLDRIDFDDGNSPGSGSYESLDDDLDSLAEEEDEQDELSDEDLAIIQQEIINYPPKLKRAVIDSITNDKLSKSDQRGLIELIKTSQKPEDVAEYLTEKLGYKVELFDKTGAYSDRGIPVIATKDIYTRDGELKRRQLLKRSALIAAAAIFAIVGLVSFYKFGLRPFQASRYYKEGIESIKKAGYVKNPSEKSKLLADAKVSFSKGEKIEPNSLEYLNKYGMAYMKVGEYDQAFEKLFGVVEPDFGAEPNGEAESWQKRIEVPYVELSKKTPWSNDKLPLGGKIIPEDEYMKLVSGSGKRQVERKIKKAGAYLVSRLEKNIHDNDTYISLGKFHSNIANLFQKPTLNGNRNYKNDNLATSYYKEVFTDGEEPNNIEATAGLAKIQYNQQNFAKSVFFYNKIVDKYPMNPIGHGGLLSNYIEMWKKDNNPTFVLNHHRQVRNALKIEGDLSLFTLAKLASFYTEITSNDVKVKYNINPEDQVTDMELQDNVEHLLNLAFFKTEKSDDGEEVKGDEFAEGYYQRGRSLLKKGETIQALKQFELSAGYDPAHYLSVLEMAEHYMRVNNYTESIDLLDNAAKRYETYKNYYGNKEEDETLFYGDYARIFFDKGKIAYLESALVSHEGKITEFPDRKVYPDKSLGQITEEESNRRKNLNNAMAMFEKAEEYKLKNLGLQREMYYYKGWIEYMRSDYEEALSEWMNLSEDDIYTNSNVMLGRANAFYNLDQLNAALGNYIKLKEDFEEKESHIARPSSDESAHQEIYNVLIAVYNNIGAIYERKGNTSSALKHYWKAIEIARKVDLTTELANHNKDLVFKTRREGSYPLLDDWLSPTIGTVKELLDTKKGKF